MARVTANDFFGQNGFNMSAILSNASRFYFFNNDDWTYWGQSYRDDFAIEFAEDDVFLLMHFAGRRIVAEDKNEISDDNEMIGGQVQAMFLDVFDTDTGNWNQMWAIQDFSVAAIDVTETMETPSLKDDTALFRSIFSGDDTFKLSNVGDVAAGYAGKDLMEGKGGRDLLFGGGGADKLLGGKGADALFGDNGNDILRGGKANDLLDGGKGIDLLYTGGGRDTIVFYDGAGRNRAMDFADDVDTLALTSDLWNGDLNRRQIVNKFATEKADRVVFDFGDDRLVVMGINDKDVLINDIQILNDDTIA